MDFRTMDFSQPVEVGNGISRQGERDEIVARIRSMLRQCRNGPYTPTNYLMEIRVVDEELHSKLSVFRRDLCDWCFQSVRDTGIDIDVAFAALSFVDRFWSGNTPSHVIATDEEELLRHGELWSVLGTTSLLLAAELWSERHSKDGRDRLNEVCSSAFNSEQLNAMHIVLLRGLRWHLHPPTVQSFLTEVLKLMSATTNINCALLQGLLSTSSSVAKCIVLDEYFIDHSAATLAFAALILAIEFHDSVEDVVIPTSEFVHWLLQELMVDLDMDEVQRDVTFLRNHKSATSSNGTMSFQEFSQPQEGSFSSAGA